MAAGSETASGKGMTEQPVTHNRIVPGLENRFRKPVAPRAASDGSGARSDRQRRGVGSVYGCRQA